MKDKLVTFIGPALDLIRAGIEHVLGRSNDPKKKAIARFALAVVTAASLGVAAYQGCSDGSIKAPSPPPVERKAAP